MASLRERDKEVIWHPYTNMKQWPEAIGIVRGEGAVLFDEDGKEYIDAISSWWVTLHGHAHSYIAQKVSEQLSVLEQCIFAGFTHEPAVQLAERLLPLLPGNMQKVFYSDNGSTAVEVALKMALQYYSNIGDKRTTFIALENAYHGDTFGAMSVSGRGIFTEPFRDKLFDVATIPFPSAEDEEKSINKLEAILKEQKVAAFIVEPLIQGAAGMQMYSAHVLEAYFKLCKQYDTFIIADEVMTGFGRTDTLFACQQVTTAPDIVCLSKGLTGGTMPMGITACNKKVYSAFATGAPGTTLHHGHSFTANPIACRASLASLDLLLEDDCFANRQRITKAHTAFIEKMKANPCMKNMQQTGTILSMTLNSKEQTSYYHLLRDYIYKYFIDNGILMRPLGNIIYLIPPYCITDQQLNYIYHHIETLLATLPE